MKNNEFNPVLYSENEMEAVEKYISDAFGDFDNVLHEILSPDIHVDIVIIEPTPEKNYYTIVTMGMGAYKMEVPEEISEFSRVELCIYLPADWKVNEQDEKWYWPMRWLKTLARLPINNNTWLGYYHTVPSGQPFAENTELSGFILDTPDSIADDKDTFCTLPNGEKVHFYTIVPLYEEEMSFKVDNGGQELMDRIYDADSEFPQLVDLNRESVVDESETLEGVVDAAFYHIQSIHEKGLEIDELNAVNHLAIYLRWFIENDLMHEKFNEYYGEVVDLVKNKHPEFDLRVFLHRQFNSRLFIYFFNDIGANFTMFYYGGDEGNPYFPSDIDSHAISYFGGEPPEMQDEEYLFVPYDEKYYNGMKVYIEKAYQKFLKNK